MTAPRCFILGHPVAHSRSPMIHGYWLAKLGLAGSYERVDVPPEGLGEFVARLRAGEFAGGNVTVPHKVAIIPHIDALTPAATAIGAVNTLAMRDGRLVGDNTDMLGFLGHLDATCPGWEATTRTALVLGAGGAARSIVHGLLSRGVGRLIVANRDPARAAALARDFGPALVPLSWEGRHAAVTEAHLIVNTTSLGMKGQPPLELDLGGLRPGTIVDDAVYVPLETELLAAARRAGARTVDGLGMLLHQAAPAFAQWFGRMPEVDAGLRALVEADIRAGT